MVEMIYSILKFLTILLGIAMVLLIVYAISKAFNKLKDSLDKFSQQQKALNEHMGNFITHQKETNEYFQKFIETSRKESQSLRQWMFHQQGWQKGSEKRCLDHTHTTDLHAKSIQLLEEKVGHLDKSVSVLLKDKEGAA